MNQLDSADYFSVRIRTEISPEGDILQTTDTGGDVYRTILSTREEQTQQALRHLGWMPPDMKGLGNLLQEFFSWWSNEVKKGSVSDLDASEVMVLKSFIAWIVMRGKR